MHEWGSDRHNNRFVACRQTWHEGSDFRIAAFFQNLIFFFVLNPFVLSWNAKMPKRSIIQESVGNKIWERDCWRLSAFFTKLYFACCYIHHQQLQNFPVQRFRYFGLLLEAALGGWSKNNSFGPKTILQNVRTLSHTLYKQSRENC